MPPEWKRDLITTDIDRLLQLLQQEESLPVSAAASRLSVEQETVMKWAHSLQQAGLIRISYSARHGKMLRLADDTARAEEQMESVAAEASGKLEEARALEQDEARLEQFEEMLERLQQLLASDEASIEELTGELDSLDADLDEIQTSMDDLSEAESEVAALQTQLDAVREDIEALTAIAEHAGRRDDADADESSGLVDRVRRLVPFLGAQGSDGGDEADSGAAAAAAGDGVDGESYKCDQCGRTFDTLRGLQTHRGMVHPEGEEA